MTGSRTCHEWVKWFLSPLMLPIREGPLKGNRWILSAGTRFYRGCYEPEKTAALMNVVQAHDVVFDIGAHVGYFTVLMSQLVGQAGQVVAFEPRPINQHFLKRHLQANRCHNVDVIEACVGNKSGKALLETRIGTGTGYVSKTGNVTVDMIGLDDWIEQGRLPKPTFLKVDVEGGEFDVLRGAVRLIETYRPRMILATHSELLDHQCQTFLIERGYRLEVIDQLKGDKEMIALPAE